MDFDLEKLLSESDPKTRPNKVLLTEDPQTNAPYLIVPDDKKEEKALKKALSPTRKDEPQKANPKMLAPPQEPVPEQLRAQDEFGLDKNKIKELLLNQQSGLAQLQQSIQDVRNAPPSVNWKPFAAFLDAGVKGQNLAAAMPEYETPEARAYKVSQLEDLLQKRRGENTENALGLLKNSLYKQQLADQRQERFNEAQGLKKEDQLRRDVLGVLSPVEDAQQMFSTMDENLGRGDYQGVMNSLSNFSRSVAGEKGVLTDQDVKRVMPATFKGDVAKFFAYFGSTDAKFDKDMIGRMQELIDVAKRKTLEKAQQNLEMRKRVYQNPSSAYYNIAAPGSGQVGDILFRDAAERVKALGGAPKQAPQSQSGLPSYEDYKKMMKRGQ